MKNCFLFNLDTCFSCFEAVSIQIKEFFTQFRASVFILSLCRRKEAGKVCRDSGTSSHEPTTTVLSSPYLPERQLDGLELDAGWQLSHRELGAAHFQG